MSLLQKREIGVVSLVEKQCSQPAQSRTVEYLGITKPSRRQLVRFQPPIVMDQDNKIPKAVAESSFRIFGIDVKCSVLDNGMRVIDADDMHKLFTAMEVGDVVEVSGELERLCRWAKGQQLETT